MRRAHLVFPLLFAATPAGSASLPVELDATRLVPPIRAEIRGFNFGDPVLLQDAQGRRLWFVLDCGWKSYGIDQPRVPVHVRVGEESCGGRPLHRIPVWGSEERSLLSIALPAVQAAARERDSLRLADLGGRNTSADTIQVMVVRPDNGVYREVAGCIQFRLRRLEAAQQGHVWPTDDVHQRLELAAPVRRSSLIDDRVAEMWSFQLFGADRRELMLGIPYSPAKPLVCRLGAGWNLEIVSDQWGSAGAEGSSSYCALVELCRTMLAGRPDDSSAEDKRALAGAHRALRERQLRILRVMHED